MPFAVTWMDAEIVIQNEVSQKQKDKNIIQYHLYVESRKMIHTDGLICKGKTETQT